MELKLNANGDNVGVSMTWDAWMSTILEKRANADEYERSMRASVEFNKRYEEWKKNRISISYFNCDDAVRFLSRTGQHRPSGPQHNDTIPDTMSDSVSPDQSPGKRRAYDIGRGFTRPHLWFIDCEGNLISLEIDTNSG